MPYKSDRQRRYMHWAKAQGKISPSVVKEFDEASRGMKLPEKVEKKSQMGMGSASGFQANSPAMAVQQKTPQVQASRIPSQPGQVPQPPTAAPSMPKMATINFISFSDEFQKIAAESGKTRSIAKDFMAGVDPTGTYTFDYGMADPGLTDRQANIRRAIGTAGGFLGGALTVPAGVSGLIGAGQAFTKARGGIGARLAAVPGGLVYGAKKPFAQLYHASRAAGVLGRAEREGAKALSDLDIAKLQKFKQYMTPTEMATIRGSGAAEKLMNDPKVIRQALAGMKPEELAALKSSVRGEASAAGMGLGMSGAIGGGSAALQYGRGRQVGAAHKKEVEEARNA